MSAGQQVDGPETSTALPSIASVIARRLACTEGEVSVVLRDLVRAGRIAIFDPLAARAPDEPVRQLHPSPKRPEAPRSACPRPPVSARS